MTFWDVGGQAVRLWKHYFDNIDAIIYVVDSTDKERLAKAKNELHRISQDSGLANVPYMIMLNKIDLAEKRLPTEEIKSRLELDTLA